MSKTTSSTKLLLNAYLEKRKVLEEQEAKIREEIAKLDDAANTFNLFKPVFEHPKSSEEVEAKPTFIATALDVIRDATPGPMTTRNVQAEVESLLGQKFSPSTASYALSRLAQRRLITRVARNQWRAK